MAGVYLVFIILLFLNASPLQQADSANYYFEGFLLLQAYLPFLDFNDNKGALFYYLLSLPALLGKWNLWYGVLFFRLVDLLVLVSLAKLLKVAGVSATARATALAAFICAYYGLFLFRDETIYSETPELLFRIIALTFYLNGNRMAQAGVFTALAILCRQTAVIDLLLIGTHQFISTKSMRLYGRYLAGAVIPIAAFVVIALSQGWFEEFYRYAILWNFNFSRFASSEESPFLLMAKTLLSLPLLPLTALALLWMIFCRRSSLIFLGILAHLLESAASPLWYSHHLIPSLAVMALAAGDLITRYEIKFTSPAARFGARTFFGLTLCVGLGLCGLQVVQFGMLEKDSAEDRKLAEWIHAHSSPTDKILVWGYASEYYLNAQRLPASRFHHNLFLTNQSRRFLPLDERALAEFRRDLNVSQPLYILLPAGEESYEDLLSYAPELKLTHRLNTVSIDDKLVTYLERRG